MGVKGLWQLLDSTGSPVTLESLENKVLGVDISIWLNQAIKGYRDKDGQPIHNAHLLGLFQRVSKLLFYRIKPVFVFDGGVPYLKKQTLLARNLQKKKAREESSKVGKQILSNYLTSHVIGKQLNENSPDEHILNLISPKKTRMQEDDLFHLPSTSISNLVTSSDSEDSWEQIEQYRSAVFGSEYQNLNDIDVDGSDFKNLPLEIRYEVLKEMKEVKKNRDLSGKQDLPEVAEDFSEFQLKKLIKKRRLQREIEIVQTEMKIQSSGEAFSQLSQDNVNCGSSNYVSQSSRVASDELTHIILLGKNKEVKKDNKTEDIKHMKSEKIIGHRYEIENRAKVLNSSIDFKDMEILIGSDNDELNVSEFQNETSEGAGNQMSESSDADEENKNHNFLLNSKYIESSDVDKDDENHKLLLNSEKKVPFETKRNISSSDENELDLPKKKIMKTDGMTPEFTMNPSNNSILGDKNLNDVDILSEKNLNESVEFYRNTKSENLNSDYSISRTATKEGDEPGIIESSDNDSEDFIEVENEKNQEMSSVQLPLEDDQNFPEIKNSKSVAGSSNDESQVTKDSNEVLEVESRTDQSVDLELKKANAEAKNVVLLEERARQERIAVSITDNMVTECQEDLKLKKANAEAENVVLLEERARQERIAVSVTDNMVTECQELLKLFGVPFIVSPMEAEAQCAKLDELQLTDGTISDDSDIWLFGGRYVYKNFFNQKRHVEGYKLADIESLLGLHREKMINIAMLTGSDYTDGIEGVGPITAMEILAEFPDDGLQPLFKFKEWWTKSKKMTTAPGNKIKAKLKTLSLANNFPDLNVFNAYMEPEVDDSKEKFSWSTPDLDMLRQYPFFKFAFQKFGWAKTKVDDILLPMLKKLNSSQTQTKLDQYFTFALKKERKAVPSKRLQNLLKKSNTSHGSSSSDTTTSKKSKNSKATSQNGKKKRPKSKLQLSSESEEDLVDNYSPVNNISKIKNINNKNVDSKIIGMSEANSLLGKGKQARKSKTKAKISIAKKGIFLSEESESE
ncbi:DNA repair protein complementing XP-G cells [Nymphon striatum]|nr:DNA repair protein complementing XP-G cells [Nymphon striatum]